MVGKCFYHCTLQEKCELCKIASKLFLSSFNVYYDFNIKLNIKLRSRLHGLNFSFVWKSKKKLKITRYTSPFSIFCIKGLRKNFIILEPRFLHFSVPGYISCLIICSCGSYQFVKSPVELNSLFLKFFCYIQKQSPTRGVL